MHRGARRLLLPAFAPRPIDALEGEYRQNCEDSDMQPSGNNIPESNPAQAEKDHDNDAERNDAKKQKKQDKRDVKETVQNAKLQGRKILFIVPQQLHPYKVYGDEAKALKDFCNANPFHQRNFFCLYYFVSNTQINLSSFNTSSSFVVLVPP